MSERIVIVGAGHAGVSVAFKLRAYGYTGPVTLVSAEAVLPYQRPPLSKKYITDSIDMERLYLKQRALYDSEQIDLLLECRVEKINRENKCVALDSGELLEYSHLVLALGAAARCLPPEQGGQANNVYTLRTLEDAKRIRGEFVEGRKLLVVGGGYIGLEAAAVARSIGMQVTLIERDRRILGRVASAETAAYFKALHQRQGVAVREGVELASLERLDGRVVAVQLGDGTSMETDAVIAGIGVIPETSIARSAGLRVGDGIMVDSVGRTDDKSIYALGDCACFPWRGRRIRLESVQNAVDMADVVAQAIVGRRVSYQSIPWFWSDQYSTKLQIAGLNHGYAQVAVRKTAEDSMSIWYYDEEHRLIAVDAINDAKAFMTARRWLGDGFSPSIEEIGNISVPLSSIALSEQPDQIT